MRLLLARMDMHAAVESGKSGRPLGGPADRDGQAVILECDAVVRKSMVARAPAARGETERDVLVQRSFLFVVAFLATEVAVVVVQHWRGVVEPPIQGRDVADDGCWLVRRVRQPRHPFDDR